MALIDPLRQIQNAARLVAGWVAPGGVAARVVVLDASGRELFAAMVPPGFSELAEKASEAPETVAGWSFTERTAKFDGKLVPVSPSRLKLLRVLVEAEGPLSGKMIAELAFGKHMGEDAARYHITSLRKELGEAFPEFEGEFIPGDGGYRVAMR